MRHVIETETMTSEEYVPKRVVPPERQQNLEVFCPSMGHACIRLQIGLKAHAQAHGDVSHSSKQRRRTEIRVRICMAPGPYEHQVAVAVFFGEHSKKHSHKKRRPPKIRIKRPHAGKRSRASLPSMAHAHIQLEAHTPLRSLPQGSLVTLLVGQVLSVASNFLEVTHNQFFF